MTGASQNPVIAQIQDRFGLEGYARYWKLIEAIASRVDKDSLPALSLPWRNWEIILAGKRTRLRLFLKFLADIGQITLREIGEELGSNSEGTQFLPGSNWEGSQFLSSSFPVPSGKQLEIKFPNILKYRDEYSRKSGHAPDNVAPETETETETEKEGKSAHPALAAFKATAEKTFHQRLGVKPSWSAKDYVQLAGLMRRHPELPEAEFTARWNRDLADTEPFVRKQGYSLAFFCSRFDSYIANRPASLPRLG